MSMFDETFAFDSTPRSPSTASCASDSSSLLLLAASTDTDRSVSPCSSVTPYPRPSFSVTDLAAQFASQRIHRDAQMCYDACASYANTSDSDADWAIPSLDDSECAIVDDGTTRLPPPLRSSTFPSSPQTSSSPHSASRRTQRQRGTRMLCTGAHRQDLAELMARMVASNTQCYTIESSPPSSPVEDEDEDSCGAATSRMPRGSRRRATQDSYSLSSASTGACVQKSVRIRRNRASRHGHGSGGGSAS